MICYLLHLDAVHQWLANNLGGEYWMANVAGLADKRAMAHLVGLDVVDVNHLVISAHMFSTTNVE